MRAWSDRLEAAAFRCVMAFFKALGRERASAFGGWLFRHVGPYIPRHKVALANMARALPELTADQRDAALLEMWDNLGRVAGEYPHLGTFTSRGAGADIEVVNRHIMEAFQTADTAAIFASGHFGNWELMPLVMAQAGGEGAEVYRAPNNALIGAWILRTRQQHIMKRQIAKGAAGSRELVKCLRKGINLCLLADQKMNDGVESVLLQRKAMSPAAPAALSLRYNVPIVPVSFERVEGTKFRLTCWPPLVYEPTGDVQADIAAVTLKLNGFFGDRIRERPGQWLWLHRRWKD